MANYTYSTDTRREDGLTAIVAERNKDRASQTPPLVPFATNQEYLTFVLDSATNSYADQHDVLKQQAVVTDYKAATKEQQAEIEAAIATILGKPKSLTLMERMRGWVGL